MNDLKQLLHGLVTEDSGQDLIEYALVAALVGLGAVAAMNGLSNSIANTFNGVGNSLVGKDRRTHWVQPSSSRFRTARVRSLGAGCLFAARSMARDLCSRAPINSARDPSVAVRLVLELLRRCHDNQRPFAA
jgi:pilus assembly protein Flp/PilA